MKTGIDVLLREKLYKKERIGLVTNPSAVTADGEPSWRALLGRGYELKAFFGPEHGFRGDAQDAVEIGDGEFRGIPSYSLFGKRLEPEPRMLEGLDALIFDMQDLGCRYYTYLYTLAGVCEACERKGKRLVLLDRPDPIGGEEVEGSPMPEAYANFLGARRLPQRTGMTLGEYARYLKGEYFPRLDLELVELEGWRRSALFDETGLPWVWPSPNIPSLGTALVYPGSCLFEGTNLSEGRGTTRPFECFGAPWIDGPEFRQALAALGLPGALFTAASFTPTFSKHQGAFCQGTAIFVTDRTSFRPLLVGIAALKLAHDRYPDYFAWKSDWEGEDRFFVDKLAGGPALRGMIDSGESLEAIYRSMTAGVEDYLEARARYLVYS
jgi:uncharacterized protein YbbC (DUF1343 family)